MSQSSDEIPFSIARDLSAFRLLELPKELLALLEKPDPPRLQIKSRGLHGEPKTNTPQKPSFAALCTPDQTFQLRQVQTSNSFYLVQPSSSSSPESALPPPASITAIASCASTLELNLSRESPLAQLKELLPLWDVDTIARPGHSKHSIYANIPLSDGEIGSVWTELCAFETAEQCYRPTSKARLSMWKNILSAALAEGHDLTSSFSRAALWESVKDEGYPEGIYNSVLLRIGIVDSKGDDISLDRSNCEIWLARLLFETDSPRISRITFLESWKNLLPGTWSNNSAIDVLGDICDLSDPQTIQLKSQQSGSAVLTKPPVAGGKRNWHEKFKKGRK